MVKLIPTGGSIAAEAARLTLHAPNMGGLVVADHELTNDEFCDVPEQDWQVDDCPFGEAFEEWERPVEPPCDSFSIDRALSFEILTVFRALPVSNGDTFKAVIEKLGTERIAQAFNELSQSKFGPAARDVYNEIARTLIEKSKARAIELDEFDRALPPGAPFLVQLPAARPLREIIRGNELQSTVSLPAPGEAPAPAMVSALSTASRWCATASEVLNDARLRAIARATDSEIHRLKDCPELKSWLSRSDMSLAELDNFEAARREWLDIIANVHLYAENIARLHQTTTLKDSSGLRWLTGSCAVGVFPDEALRAENFPGTVLRDEKGNIRSVSLTLPDTLERTPANIAKMRQLSQWLERNAPKVDRILVDIFKAGNEANRILYFADVPVEEGHDASPEQAHNYLRKRFTAKAIEVDGRMMLKVTTSDQRLNAGTLSYLRQFGQVSNVGQPELSGQFTVGDTVIDTFDKELPVGTGGVIQTSGEGISSHHCTIRVTQGGRLYVKAQPGCQVLLNGKPVSSTEYTRVVDPNADTLTLGVAKVVLPVVSNIRLYEMNDWVPVALDGQMHLIEASKLPAFANECYRWYGISNGATLLMDAGMALSGGLAFRFATRRAALEISARQCVGKQSITTMEAFLHSWKLAPYSNLHALTSVGFASTGFLHQSIENTGPGGRAFMEYRGWAMLADISYNSVFKDLSSGLSKLFSRKTGIAALTEIPFRPSSSEHLAKGGLQTIMNVANALFASDIMSRQLPAIAAAMFGSADFLSDASLPDIFGAGKKSNESLSRLRNEFLRFSTNEQRAGMMEILSEADCLQEAKAYGAPIEDTLKKLGRIYLNSHAATEKVAAAVALLQLGADANGHIPRVIVQVLKDENSSNDKLPELIKSEDLLQFLLSNAPVVMNPHNRFESVFSDSYLRQAERLLLLPQSDQRVRHFTNSMASMFLEGGPQKVAAALALRMLCERDGRLPPEISVEMLGKQVPISEKDIQDCIVASRRECIEAIFGTLQRDLGEPESKVFIDTTRALLKRIDEAGGVTRPSKLASDVEDHADTLVIAALRAPKPNVAALVSLMLLEVDPQTGRLREDFARISAADTISRLQRCIADLSPATRTATASLIYMSGHAPLGGRSAEQDLLSTGLSILNDKRATADDIISVLTGQTAPGLVQLACRQRFDLLQGSETASFGQGWLEVQSALERLFVGSNDANLQALAMRALLALMESDRTRRNIMLRDLNADNIEMKAGAPASGALSAHIRELEQMRLTAPARWTERQLNITLLLNKLPNKAQLFPAGDAQWFGDTIIKFCNPNNHNLFVKSFEVAIARYDSLSDNQKANLIERAVQFVRSGSERFDSEVLIETGARVVNQLFNVLRAEGSSAPSSASSSSRSATVLTALLEIFRGKSGASERVREQIALGAGGMASFDEATRAALSDALSNDSSARVRAASFESLKRQNVFNLPRICMELLPQENDLELRRRMQAVIDNHKIDSRTQIEAQRLFFASSNRIAAGADVSLKDSLQFIKDRYPLLVGGNLYQSTSSRYSEQYAGVFGFSRWMFSSNEDLQKTWQNLNDKSKAEMRKQLSLLCAAACRNSGETERTALAWLLITNGQALPMGMKQEVLEHAATALSRAARESSPKARKEVAPLIMMCVGLAHELPLDCKADLLSGLRALVPDTIRPSEASAVVLQSIRAQLRTFSQEITSSSAPAKLLYLESLVDFLETFPCGAADSTLRAFGDWLREVRGENIANEAMVQRIDRLTGSVDRAGLQASEGVLWMERQMRSAVENLPPEFSNDSKTRIQELVAELHTVLNSDSINTEYLCKLALFAGFTAPILSAEDPRRELFLRLSELENERVRLSVALILRNSRLREDQLLSLKLLAGLRGSQSVTLSREVARILEPSFCPPLVSFEERDRILADSQSLRNKTESRAATNGPMDFEYESARLALARQTRLQIAECNNASWWARSAYPLLHEHNFDLAAGTPTSDPNNRVQLERQRTEQFERLLRDSADVSQKGAAACKALSHILLHNGAPLPHHRRKMAVERAAVALAEVYEKGGPNASDTGLVIKTAMCRGAALDDFSKIVFSNALTAAAQDSARNITEHELVLIHTAALEAELFHVSGSKYGSQYCSHLIRQLAKFGNSICLPILRAIAEESVGDQSVLSRDAELAIEEISNTDLSELRKKVTVDLTSSAQKLADRLEAVANSVTESGATESSVIQEIFRLARSTTLANESAVPDPRINPLRRLLASPRSRIALAAATVLLELEPLNQEALAAVAALSRDPQVGQQAGLLLDKTARTRRAP